MWTEGITNTAGSRFFNHSVSNLILDPLLSSPDYLFASSMYLLTECIHLFVCLPTDAYYSFPRQIRRQRFLRIAMKVMIPERFKYKSEHKYTPIWRTL